jgi:uncharacterized membrane protein YphA (DoxX/SURF4 family)
LIRRFLPLIITLTGCLLVLYGVRLVSEAAAWILCGLLLIAAGLVHDWERGA